MELVFQEHILSLDPAVDRLLASPAWNATTLPRVMPRAGIYLFSEDEVHLYVGRTNNLRRRLVNHYSESADHNKATFAFLIARRNTGKLKATYKPEGSRAALLKDPEFSTAFREAKARLRSMTIRFVEEVDPIRQALLEIYSAMRLSTPFNDFNNH